MIRQFFSTNKHALLYGLSLACLIALLKGLEIRYFIFDHSIEIYIGAIAIIFTALGIWLAMKLSRPKIERIVVEKEVFINSGPSVVNEKEITKIGLSNREIEVLRFMAKGLSNQEIASQLYVSLNTVKTHASNIFMKLDVNKRVQAIEKARELGLLNIEKLPG
ncbi:MAG: response regulator transcription factor [Bacteroidetes bacterium]|nr:response regulator transcription factor [Bacteroidota bacterium]